MAFVCRVVARFSIETGRLTRLLKAGIRYGTAQSTGFRTCVQRRWKLAFL